MENQSPRKLLKNKINYRLFLKPSQNKTWDGFFYFILWVMNCYYTHLYINQLIGVTRKTFNRVRKTKIYVL